MAIGFQIQSKIKGQPNLLRPLNGGGVINLDEEGYQRALARIRLNEQNHRLEERVGNLESKLDKIIELLGNVL